jgi:hypothetical protein
MKAIFKEKLPVKTYSWKAYGNNVPEAVIALNELVQNAIAAGLRTGNSCVSIEIKKELDGTYIYVMNTGDPAEIKKVLDYGQSTQETALNQFGTGFKTAMSYFNPSNDAWEFWTRHGEHSLMAKAPYSDFMCIETFEQWPWGDKFVSCARVRVENESRLEGIDIDALGFRYALAIEKGAKILFNGEKVYPIMPCGMTDGVNTEIIDFGNGMAKISYATYKVGLGAAGSRFYSNSQADQGVHLFVNGCFVKNLGTREVLKKYGDDKKIIGRPPMLKEHPSMNGIIAVVNIETPHNHCGDIPFDNTKCNIKWDDTEAGKTYKAVINKCVGGDFRKAKGKGTERNIRDMIRDTIVSLLAIHDDNYKEEVALGNELRADAVICSEMLADGTPDLAKAIAIVEYKSQKISSKHIGQLVNYYSYICGVHGARPICYIAGKSITKDALDHIKRQNTVFGIDMRYLPINMD